jgi:hypothetical protein
VNSRNNVPTVEGAYTPSKSVFMPPDRITSMSSMQSAPAHIAAISVASFGAGFADPDLIRGALSDLDPIVACEHQSSQFRGHFPHSDTQTNINSSVDQS